MHGEDEEETKMLKVMLSEAESYIASFHWSQPIKERYLGFGVGNVVALFLFRFDKPIRETDDWLWVVVGDLPSAYFVVCRFSLIWKDAVVELASKGQRR